MTNKDDLRERIDELDILTAFHDEDCNCELCEEVKEIEWYLTL